MAVNRNSAMKLLHQPFAGFFVQQILQVQPVEDFVRPIIQSQDLDLKPKYWSWWALEVPQRQRPWVHRTWVHSKIGESCNNGILIKPLVRAKELSVLPRLMRKRHGIHASKNELHSESACKDSHCKIKQDQRKTRANILIVGLETFKSLTKSPKKQGTESRPSNPHLLEALAPQRSSISLQSFGEVPCRCKALAFHREEPIAMFQGLWTSCFDIPKTKEPWNFAMVLQEKWTFSYFFHRKNAPSIRAAEEETDLTVAHLWKMLVLRAKHLYEKRYRQLFTFHSPIYMYLTAYRMISYDAPKISKNLKETKWTWNIKW